MESLVKASWAKTAELKATHKPATKVQVFMLERSPGLTDLHPREEQFSVQTANMGRFALFNCPGVLRTVYFQIVAVNVAYQFVQPCIHAATPARSLWYVTA
jgi:hypothetical protein